MIHLESNLVVETHNRTGKSCRPRRKPLSELYRKYRQFDLFIASQAQDVIDRIMSGSFLALEISERTGVSGL